MRLDCDAFPLPQSEHASQESDENGFMILKILIEQGVLLGPLSKQTLFVCDLLMTLGAVSELTAASQNHVIPIMFAEAQRHRWESQVQFRIGTKFLPNTLTWI